MEKTKDRLWVTWETQRRNKELADVFGCKYIVLDYSHRHFFIRYIISSWHTAKHILFNPYRVVFSQCPSLVLVVLVLLLSTIKRFVFVIDAHNATFDYANSESLPMRVISRYALRKARFVIVSNDYLSRRIKLLGGNPLVLPDKLPNIAKREKPQFLDNYDTPILTLISSFAPDEPTEIFLQTFNFSDLELTLFVTGKKERAGKLIVYESERIYFTDYLNEEEYEALIQHSDLLIVLTLREECLLCGAYESASVCVPALLSDTQVLRETFKKGYLFSKNNVSDYQNALKEFFRNQHGLKEDISEFKKDYELRWEEIIKNIQLIIDESQTHVI
jgi:hypothetical protein